MIRSYRDLHVWQPSLELVLESYRINAAVPRSQVYGLVSQLHRAAVSVPANIDEGHGRETARDGLTVARSIGAPRSAECSRPSTEP